MEGEYPKPVIAIVEISFLNAIAQVYLIYSIFTIVYIYKHIGNKDSYLINIVSCLTASALFTVLSTAAFLAYIIIIFYQRH